MGRSAASAIMWPYLSSSISPIATTAMPLAPVISTNRRQPTTMELPVIRTVAEEHWDCQSCGICCRGSIILLSESDLQKIREQQWDDDPDYRGKKLLVRDPRAGSGQRLNQRPDGSCVFLTEAGRCRIHEKFGSEAKPLVCRVFPRQLIPRERQ